MDNISPALYIGDVDDLNEPVDNPMNGIDYIKNVMFERNVCPETVTAPMNIERFNKKQTVFTQLPPKISSSDNLIPTLEWQTLQEADFSVVRCRMLSLYNSKEQWLHDIELPKIANPDSNESWKTFIESNLPQLSLVFTMTQPILEFVLNVLIETLNDIKPGEGLSRHSGLWLYSILALIKLPLTPETCSSLRDLARKCQLIRSKLDASKEDIDEIIIPLNLFICLVARYFRQGDLRD